MIMLKRAIMAAIGLACLTAAGGAGVPSAQETGAAFSYTTSWFGNSFGGGPAPPGTDNKHVQLDVDAIAVLPDGTVYTNSGYDESGLTAGIYRNGDLVGNLDALHGWGRGGGKAIAANGKYVYAAIYQEGCDGGDYPAKNVYGQPRYPKCGDIWQGVRRYLPDGKPAPFAGGYGYDGSISIQNFSKTGAVAGLAVSARGELFISDPANGKIRVRDGETMRLLREWQLERPGAMAIDKSGYLWVVQSASGSTPAAILKFNRFGQRQLPSIALPPGAAPVSLAFDGWNRLHVADNGSKQQIRVYGGMAAIPLPIGTFGKEGGILSGTPGEVAPLKFNGLTGVGVDAGGNIYVSMNGYGPNVTHDGFGTVLESYTRSGSRLWQLHGLEFVDAADADPATDGVHVYTGQEHFVLDYSKGSGQEAVYRGFTLNRFQYPQDYRLFSGRQTPFVRNVRGHRLLYITDMYANMLSIYRFDPGREGETAIPSGFFSRRRLQGGTIPHQPSAGEWIWRDKNGNGAFNEGEYESKAADAPTLWGWWVDDNGDIWQALTAGKGIRRFPLQGFDGNGNPIYSYGSMVTYPAPSSFTDLMRIVYDAGTDTMFLSGYASDRPVAGKTWGLAGNVLMRFDGWSKGNRVPSWRIELPYRTEDLPDGTKKTLPKALAAAGRYLFVAEVFSSNVDIYDARTGKHAGTLKPGPEINGKAGWIDLPHAISAIRRGNGEYVVFLEDDAYAKIVMYRVRLPE